MPFDAAAAASIAATRQCAQPAVHATAETAAVVDAPASVPFYSAAHPRPVAAIAPRLSRGVL